MALKVHTWGAALIRYYTHELQPKHVEDALRKIGPSLQPLRKDEINLGRREGFTVAVVPNVRPNTSVPAAVFQHWDGGKPIPTLKPVLERAARIINLLHAGKL